MEILKLLLRKPLLFHQPVACCKGRFYQDICHRRRDDRSALNNSVTADIRPLRQNLQQNLSAKGESAYQKNAAPKPAVDQGDDAVRVFFYADKLSITVTMPVQKRQYHVEVVTKQIRL